MSTADKSTPVIGRTTRLEYWLLMFFFVTPICLIVEYSRGLGGLLVLMILLIPVIHAQIGRWHDLGCSGWLALLAFIPIVGFIVSIPLLFVKGEQKNNSYGPSPYIDKYQ